MCEINTRCDRRLPNRDFVCFYYIIWVIFLVFFLKNFGSKKVLLSLLRNKDEMLSSFMSANAIFLDYQELSIVVWYSNSGSSVTNRKTSAGQYSYFIICFIILYANFFNNPVFLLDRRHALIFDNFYMLHHA
jgi:hypothetical protein